MRPPLWTNGSRQDDLSHGNSTHAQHHNLYKQLGIETLCRRERKAYYDTMAEFGFIRTLHVHAPQALPCTLR